MAPRRPPGSTLTAERRALGRIDGPRGQRVGSGRRGGPGGRAGGSGGSGGSGGRGGGRPTARARRVRSRRRLIAGTVCTVLLLGVLIFAVFPTRTWWEQRNDTRTAEAQLAEVRAEREEVEREAKLLETDEEVARRAREEAGLVKPGEEAYNILPAPTDPIGLPEGWPFTGVERALGAR